MAKGAFETTCFGEGISAWGWGSGALVLSKRWWIQLAGRALFAGVPIVWATSRPFGRMEPPAP